MPTRARRVKASSMASRSSATRMILRSRPIRRPAQDANWPVSAMCMAPGMCAPPNWPEGRVSSTSAPACCCARDVLGQHAIRNGKIGERRGAGAIQLRVLREVSGTLGKFAGQQAHEFLPGFRLEGEVGDALLADRGTALRTHLAAAQGAGAVRGIDLHRIGQGEELGVQAVVEQAGELLRACDWARGRDVPRRR